MFPLEKLVITTVPVKIFKMLKFLLFLAVLKLVVAKFDPGQIDYCNIYCKRYVSSGCNCVEAKDRTYVTEGMQGFRQLVLDQHNLIRNLVAVGNLSEFKPAANMHILQYDLELEHLARCYIMRPNFTHGHDMCRQTSYCESSSWPGQNIAGSPEPKWDDASIKRLISLWYQEWEILIEMDPDRTVINKFRVLPFAYRQFTQLIWATTEKVGCARALIPRNPEKNFTFTLVCNYAGPPDNCAGNVPGEPVYLVGEPCSKCGDTKCTKDFDLSYDALCVEPVKAPDEAPASFSESPDNASTKAPGNASSEAPDETTTQNWKEEGSTGSRNFTNKFFTVFIIIFEVVYH